MDKSLITLIESTIHKVQKGNFERLEIYTANPKNGKNEFLFFIKPEITLSDSDIQLNAILEMILYKIEAFNLHIRNILLLPAAYLEKHGIIAMHYGIINSIARNAKENLSAEAKEKFHSLYNTTVEEAEILGGIEFITKYPDFTPTTTDYLWQNAPVQKLGGGAYCGSVKLDGKTVFLVNGFHPRQLEHFIARGRCIIAFTLTGDIKWSAARNQLIGKTNPVEAENGSIRRSLLDGKVRFGLKTVSSSWNGVHLSAGPIEGLIELMRYNSDFDRSVNLASNDFYFGRQLAEVFNANTMKEILKNPSVEFEGKKQSVFDLTEEKDSSEALSILKQIF